jgi:hypothetical protein
MRRLTWLFVSLAVAFTSALVAHPAPAGEQEGDAGKLPAAAKQTVDFKRDVQPILRKTCYSCHGSEMQEAGLRLDLKKRAIVGGDGGVVIVPGKSAESRLIHLVAGLDKDTGFMPPEGEGTPLTVEQVALLRAWIDQGAVWPDDADVALRGSAHWAFQPVTRPPLPVVKDTSWPRGAIDCFILSRLEKEKIPPSPEADRPTLIRRLYFDLLGLPPTPAEVAQFVEDARPDAYEQLVERVLTSPHYGERFGRYWLDVARYADSDGYEKDRPRPHAWRYRNWVIDALNADMPFDRFTVEQLAGDLLPGATAEQLAATGFHRNTLHNTEGGADPEEDRVKKTVDRTNTLGTVWLGLTVGCAQCHTHKYDPITQREYYSLYAFFNSINEVDVDAPLAGVPSKDVKAQAVSQQSTPRPTKIHIRGDFLSPGDTVQPESLAVLPPLQPREKQPDRLDLAHWVVDPANPLTARVTANRLWQRIIGRGIVATSDDFGSQGEVPSHPELLDWLAGELVQNNWSMKHIQRLIVTSATYRQSSATRTELVDIDPQNVLLARQNRQRVEAEIIRDLALAVGGLLDARIGGPSVRPPQPAEYSSLTYANSAKWEVSKGGDKYRRGMYTFFQRTSPYPMLMTFDSPDTNECCVRRSHSNTPLQALTLWNDPVFFECAQTMGRRVVGDVPPETVSSQTVRNRARHIFQLCLAREPAPNELTIVVDLYEGQLGLLERDEKATTAIVGSGHLPEGVSNSELASWISVGRALMNLDEFITRE